MRGTGSLALTLGSLHTGWASCYSRVVLPASYPGWACSLSPKGCRFEAESRTSGTSESNFIGTLPIFWQGPCPAGCTLLEEEVGWAPWPPLHPQLLSVALWWDVLAPGNCPWSPFGGIALPSADLCSSKPGAEEQASSQQLSWAPRQ